ncbi:MAG: DipZ protein [Thermoleophilaceae bacterium]
MRDRALADAEADPRHPLRLPADNEAFAPEFPAGLQWVNVAFLRMAVQIGRPVLVEFFDFARINSLRTLPYTVAWDERYGPAGLRVIGVHSPGYSFGRDPDVAVPAIEKLGIPYAVVLDPDFVVWREYGNRGWPARYLFDRRGVLRLVHWGEGEYDDAEAMIHELLDEADTGVDLPPPMEPLRPEDRPGAALEPQTADVVLPADRGRLELTGDWTEGTDYIEATTPGATARVPYRAGEAYAVLSGTAGAGLHPTSGTITADTAGLRLHGFQFTPIPPSGS